MVWLYLPPEAITHAQKGARCSASRSARARLCGNGVVPLVVAYAFRTLAFAAALDE